MGAPIKRERSLCWCRISLAYSWGFFVDLLDEFHHMKICPGNTYYGRGFLFAFSSRKRAFHSLSYPFLTSFLARSSMFEGGSSLIPQYVIVTIDLTWYCNATSGKLQPLLSWYYCLMMMKGTFPIIRSRRIKSHEIYIMLLDDDEDICSPSRFSMEIPFLQDHTWSSWKVAQILSPKFHHSSGIHGLKPCMESGQKMCTWNVYFSKMFFYFFFNI